MSRAVPDWFRASALRGIPNAGWARAVSESVVSWRRGVGIVIRIGNDMRLAKMHSPAVASHGAANPPPSVRSDQATRSRLIGDSTSIHAGAHEREILNIPKLPEVKSSALLSWVLWSRRDCRSRRNARSVATRTGVWPRVSRRLARKPCRPRTVLLGNVKMDASSESPR